MQRQEMRITRWGLYSNVGLTFAKFIGGILGNSSALIADGVHSVSDMLADAVTMITIKHSSLPADVEHPWGHGRIEDVGTGVVAGVLVMTGLGMGWSSIEAISEILNAGDNAAHAHAHGMHPDVVNTVKAAAADPTYWNQIKNLVLEGFSSGDGHGHSHSHGLDAHSPTPLALGIAVASVLTKEVLFHLTMRVARKTNSKIVEVNAWHHRSDSLSSMVAVIGVAGAMMSVPVLDPAAALFVAALITKQGWTMGTEVYHALTDHDVDAEVKGPVAKSLDTCSVFGVVGYHGLRGRRMGRYSVIDVNILVPRRLSVSAAHQVAECVRQQIRMDVPLVAQVQVHVDIEGDFEQHQHEHHPHTHDSNSTTKKIPMVRKVSGNPEKSRDLEKPDSESEGVSPSKAKKGEIASNDMVLITPTVVTAKNIDQVNEATNKYVEYHRSRVFFF
jgi:divalent metal cation (Fe/Co/Zn/Cd) transporter